MNNYVKQKDDDTLIDVPLTIVKLEQEIKRLRSGYVMLMNDLRALEGPVRPWTEGEINPELDTPTSWPEISSFSVYIYALGIIQGATPKGIVHKYNVNLLDES